MAVVLARLEDLFQVVKGSIRPKVNDQVDSSTISREEYDYHESNSN